MAVSITQLTPLTGRLAHSTTKGISKNLSMSVDSGLMKLGGEGRPSSVNPNLGMIEVEQMIRDQVTQKHRDLLQAFQTYDIDKTHSVTKGEFKRVLELFCDLNPDQFKAILNKVDTNRNGTIKYRDFLNKFYNSGVASRSGARTAPHQKGSRTTPRLLTPIPQSEMEDYDEMEVVLRDKIERNMKTILKALRLFDYVGDRKIQRHELQKVLENYCFKISPKHLTRLWQKTDCGNIVDYQDFFRRLNVSISRKLTQIPDSTAAALNWPQREDSSTIKPGVNRGKGLEMHSINFFELEQEFRKKMKENYAYLVKTFLSFDATRSGFVTIDQLRSVLNQFAVPLTEDMFHEMMLRCGVKATGKIAWMTFMERFQDPLSTSNGSTLPIKSRVKCNPHQGVGHSAQIRDIVALIHGHVNMNFYSFRTAFLKIDRNRSGRITRSELKRVLENFKLAISDDQFRDLMQVLDPEHTGSISYHAFLEMFEPRETKEGHKWLKSMHRYNDQQKPAIMAWATVEDLLNQRLTNHWKQVETAIHQADPNGTGFMSAGAWKRIVDREGLPTSKEHFENIVSRLPKRDNNSKLCYLDFLSLLKIEGQPGDQTGLSQQITDTHDATTAQRDCDHRNRMEGVKNNAQVRTEGISDEEMMVRIRDRISQHHTFIRDAFLQADPNRKGYVKRSELKKIFESYELLMSDEQFDSLAARLGLERRNDVMDYRRFVANFADPRTTQSESEISQHLSRTNHKVNEIRGDRYGMSAEDVEAKLREKLRQNFICLRDAFHKFDDQNRGRLSKANFRRMLDSTMCVLSDTEFEKLCEKLGIHSGIKIDYRTFLEKFEMRDNMVDGHKWLNSDHRFNEERPLLPLSAERVQTLLAEKVHQHYQDVAQAFCHIDNRGRGVITRKDFQVLLGKFNILMDADQFKELWKHYDQSGRGAITYDMFLKRVGVGAQFTSGDQGGTSEKIIQDSHDAITEHLDKQQTMHEQLTFNQAILGAHLQCQQIYEALRVRIRDDFRDTFSAFKRYDKENKGYLSHNDIQLMLSDLHLFINDRQFGDLMEHIGINKSQPQLTYAQFCTAFDEDTRGPKQGLVPMVHNLKFANDGGVGPIEAEKKLRDHITKNFEILKKAFLAFDEPRKGSIPVADFHRILDNFVFSMSVSNFKHILSKCQLTSEGFVDYVSFLNTFNLTADQHKISSVDLIPDAEVDRWMMQHKSDKGQSSQNKLEMVSITDVDPAPAPPVAVEEIADRLRQVVRARPQALQDDLEAVDYAGLGVVAKEDFREILHRHVMRVSDQQFESLWPLLLPINHFGNLNYKELFEEGDESAAQEEKEKEKLQIEVEETVKQLEEIKPMEARLTDLCRHQWRNVFNRCKESDANGEMTILQFSQILNALNLKTSVKELAPLLRRFGLRGESGLFRYQDLLRTLVLHTPKAEPVELIKQKMNKANIPLKSKGNDSRDLFPCMHRIRDRILGDWKNLRREFKKQDTNGLGQVSPKQLRTILTKFGLQLDEDEFYHVMTHFDRELRGSIDYNEFIKSFLNTA